MGLDNQVRAVINIKLTANIPGTWTRITGETVDRVFTPAMGLDNQARANHLFGN
jgi:hypothetical protein